MRKSLIAAGLMSLSALLGAGVAQAEDFSVLPERVDASTTPPPGRPPAMLTPEQQEQLRTQGGMAVHEQDRPTNKQFLDTLHGPVTLSQNGRTEYVGQSGQQVVSMTRAQTKSFAQALAGAKGTNPVLIGGLWVNPLTQALFAEQVAAGNGCLQLLLDEPSPNANTPGNLAVRTLAYSQEHCD
ncbi:hypothetical protein [Aldersonia kunmingensis]|uniref:hypothetical protein n=1 Tax=Aldersonia kunmingensis TaxID=408066 RepID=UPI0008348F9A|nr:hypothetical protein [Aldersonia kunmingensis]